jgi:asparagine synthase (glutamine-hydrolysing)
MCGIVGVISRSGGIDLSMLDRQRDSMAHRGPDSCGSWISDDGRVAFGHRRLAIIDLSPGGHQPMVDSETGNAICFNGEIYNFVALRDRLIQRGHSFRTRSDTEVILAAYREWSVDCVKEMSGMFAFALYDRTKEQVLLARDRAGEKPLFYSTTNNGQLVFGSEVKALLLHPSVSRTASRHSLNEYFAYGYVTGENTMLKEVKRVLPGGRAVFDLRSGEFHLDRYWTLPVSSPKVVTAKPSEAQSERLLDELHTLLRSSIEQQLVADVPVGVLLSGGVDSSIVSAIASEVSAKKIRTYTARFPGNAQFDEGPFAKMVAQHIGAEHVELEAKPATEELLRRLAAQYDDPIADSSMLPTYLVTSEIRKHATVALGGDGGDELFGGYHRHPIHIRQQELRQRIPLPARQLVGALARAVRPGVRGRNFLMALAGDGSTSIAAAGRLFRDDERAALSDALRNLSPAELTAPERLRMHIDAARHGILQRSTGIDFSTYMVDDVLVKVDRASMLTSLEVRAPFLDHRVIEFAFSKVPDVLRATKRDRKILLRRLGARLLPPALDLKRKQGFSIPVDAWFRGEWNGLLRDETHFDSVLVSNAALQRYSRALNEGRMVGDRLFALILLRLWERSYSISDVS